MTTLYRRLRLKYGLTWGVRPGRLAQCAKDALFLSVLLFAFLAVYGWVQAQDEADRQADQARTHKTSLTPALEILARCLSRGDNLIQIGDRPYVCGATPL